MDKLSDAISAISLCGFNEPRSPQRESDLAIALFYAQIAWNRSNGDDMDKASIELIRGQMAIPDELPTSFKYRDTEALTAAMVRFKEQRFPNDRRIIVACLFENERLKVHWREGVAA